MSQVHLRSPLLFGGISQQPPELRFDSQVEDADNTVFSVVNGARKRPGSMHLKEVSSLDLDRGFRLHAIERDNVEKYVVIFGEGVLRVFEADGREATVNVTSAAQTYLEKNSPNPDQLRIISIRDFTFILNTTVAVKAKSSGGATDNELDETTMPIQMVRTTAPTASAAAVFDVSLVTWTDRAAGNNTNNPVPSLWDEEVTLSDISFHRNRLVLTGREFVVFSQAADLFNFYLEDPTTGVLDTDPIDLSLATTEVTIVDFIVPFRKSLVIFTKASRQFELNAPESLTPDTAAISASTSYRTLPVRPEVLGSVVYFPGAKRGSASLYEYFYDDSRVTNVAADVTSHVPHFLSNELRSLATSTNDQMVFALPRRGTGGVIGSFDHSQADAQLTAEDGDALQAEDGDILIVDQIDTGSNVLGVYRAHWRGNEKQQSAWSKYTFHSDYRISDVAVVGNALYMLVQHDGRWALEVMLIDPELSPADPVGSQFLLPGGGEAGGRDADSADYPYVVHLDNMMRAVGSYDSGADETTWTLPMTDNTLDTIVMSGDGQILTPDTNVGGTVTKSGDHSDGEAIIGRAYTQSLELSRPFVRDREGRADANAWCQVRRTVASAYQTGKLTMRTTQSLRSQRSTSFQPGTVKTYATLTAWHVGRALELRQFIENDSPYPSTVTSVERTVDYAPRRGSN